MSKESSKLVNSAEPWRIVFFGSDNFSCPGLEALNKGPDQVVLVVTPPPKPAGRGRKLTPTLVAKMANDLGLPLLETKSVRDEETLAAISAIQPDLLVVSAFGGFLPEELLTLGKFPPLNVHPSLLPRHRGPAPINWALIQGDECLGVSIIFLEKEMDAGPILRQCKIPSSAESAAIWEERLALLGAEELLVAVSELKEARATITPQDHAQATVNPLLTKADGHIDWHRPATEIRGLINGVDPWPGAQTLLQGKNLKVFGAEVSATETDQEPGKCLGLDEQNRLLVATGLGVLALKELLPEGKKRLAAADFWRGYRPECLGKC